MTGNGKSYMKTAAVLALFGGMAAVYDYNRTIATTQLENESEFINTR
jgi:hypothetical protein